MEVNLNELMDEYAYESFEALPTHYRKHPVGFVEPGYQTYLSAFLFPVKGEGYYKLDDQSFRFRPGMVIHGCPGKWLTSGNLTDQTLEFYVMYYRATRGHGGYMSKPFELEIGTNPTLLSLLKTLSKVTDRPDPSSKFQAKALMFAVLSEVFSSANSQKKTETHAMVEEAKGYLEFHHMRQHTLCDLAGRYGMCPKYFSEVFKKFTGLGPIDYLIGYRMKQAYKLLLSTRASIKEISQTVGYADAYYFSRLFKKHFGFSPSRIRDNPLEQAN